MSAGTNSGGIFKITLNLTLACVLSGLIIAGVFFITQPYANANRVKAKKDSLAQLVPAAESFKPVAGKTDWFVAVKGGNEKAYILPAEGKGYGGAIRMMLAVDLEQKIIGYKILSHNETPGLGDKAALPEFSAQFAGKKKENMQVVKMHEEGKIDAISGATITSKAVTTAFKDALSELEEWLAKK